MIMCFGGLPSVAKYLEDHPQMRARFVADPAATLAAEGIFLSDAQVDDVVAIVRGEGAAPTAPEMAEQQARVLAAL